MSDVKVGKLYLAKFTDGKWHRGSVSKIKSEEKIGVSFLEYGNSHPVSLSDLSLEKLPECLSCISPQAILVRLDSVPPSICSQKLADQIRELAPNKVLVERKTYEDIPKVEIFVCYGPKKLIMSISKTIIMDLEFSNLVS